MRCFTRSLNGQRALYGSMLLFFLGNNLMAQDFGGIKVGMANFVRRMYNSQPFSGVKVLQSETGGEFIIAVVELKKDAGKSETVQNQVAAVKGKAYVSQYLNSSHISSEVVIITSEGRSTDSTAQKSEFVEILKESSSGFVNGLELLIKFVSERADKLVYVFAKEIRK